MGITNRRTKYKYLQSILSHWLVASLASLLVGVVIIKSLVSSIIAHLLFLLPNCKSLPAHGAGAVPEQRRWGVQEECGSNNEKLSTLTAILQGRWGGKRGVWMRHTQEAAAAKKDLIFWFQKMARCCSLCWSSEVYLNCFCAGYRCSLHPPAGQLGKGRGRWGSCRWSTRPPSESPGPYVGQIGK